MGVVFNGGERLQRGRGIGGILKFAAKLFSPLKSIAKTAIKSDSGKKIAKALKKQAVTSSINIANDLADGKSFKKSVEDEIVKSKTNSKRKALKIGSEYLSNKLDESENKTKRKKVTKKKKNNKKKIKRDIFG